jgi:glycosyltransferase involved in cell wall biosynthesis
MHVCHFCDLTFEGEFFRLMITGLAERGIRVSLIELAPGSPPTWLSGLPDVSYQSLNVTSKLQYPNAVRRVAAFVKAENVDILHTHLYFAGVIGVLTKRLQRRAVVAVMRHHSSIVRLLGWGIHIAADKWMAEKADHVITVSEGARRYMTDVDGIRRDDIDVVYIGFDFDKVAPSAVERERVRRELGFDEGDFVIGYVSTLVPGKGHLQLIEAFRSIRSEIPSARLMLVGGGEYDAAARAAAEFPAGSIIFTGFRDDIPACLNVMDLFVQPSLSEAFSRVIVEAMGVGLPVIATRVGGADEVIENGVNGVLVPSDDVDALHRETVRLYRDAEVRDAIASNGMDSVRERFTAARMVDGLVKLYKSWLPVDDPR